MSSGNRSEREREREGKTKKDERVEALEKRENFVKVLGVDSDFVGWVKEESFEKN